MADEGNINPKFVLKCLYERNEPTYDGVSLEYGMVLIDLEQKGFLEYGINSALIEVGEISIHYSITELGKRTVVLNRL